MLTCDHTNKRQQTRTTEHNVIPILFPDQAGDKYHYYYTHVFEELIDFKNDKKKTNEKTKTNKNIKITQMIFYLVWNQGDLSFADLDFLQDNLWEISCFLKDNR